MKTGLIYKTNKHCNILISNIYKISLKQHLKPVFRGLNLCMCVSTRLLRIRRTGFTFYAGKGAHNGGIKGD